MKEFTIISASILGAIAIIFGAFAAHLFKQIFTADLQKSFETGVKYQMYHAIVLLVLGFHLNFRSTADTMIVWFLFAGTILFSFSIYGLCISSSKGKKLKILGPITPLGGLFLIIGWLLLSVKFL